MASTESNVLAKARSRAFSKLAACYPDEYKDLLASEARELGLEKREVTIVRTKWVSTNGEG